MARMNSLFPDELAPKTPKGKRKQTGGPQMARRPSQGGPAASAKRTPVKDLVAGQEVFGTYLVQDASLRLAKNGSKYIQATLADKTGSIPVRQWDASDKDFASYKQGNYVDVRGRVETYQNRLQMITMKAEPADDKNIDPAEFLPMSKRDLKEMEKEFDALLDSFSDPDYKRLLASIFSDPEVRRKFLCGPAAMSVHHAWVGGLLEHVLSAAATAEEIAKQRPFLNRDLLIAGVILHDIGKIEELDGGPGFNYTDGGRLCGHIALGSMLVERNIIKLKDFPDKKRYLILHMILSHHGSQELGSPVKPYTAEAVALHHVECLDAKVQGIQSFIERDSETGNDGAWTDFARVADGRIFKG